MKKTLAFLLLLTLGGCSFTDHSTVELPYPADYGYSEPYGTADSTTESKDKLVDDTSGVTLNAQDEKIIKTGTLTLHMEDVRESVDAVKTQVETWGGEVMSSTLSRYGDAYYAYMTVRVPSDQFDTALDGLKNMALYVEEENTSAEDITETYMDLEARINNLKEEEQQYLAVLDKAQTVDEILQVTDALSEVRYEIESAETQQKYYDSNVDYSTINLTLTEDESVAAVQETWRPLGTLHEALSDWYRFLQAAVDSGIYVLIFGWPLLPVLLLVWWFWRRGRKRRK